MKAAAVERDITPPVGVDIPHPIRPCIGIHDPLRLGVLVMEDGAGTRVTLIRYDLVGVSFDVTEALQDLARREFGIDHLLINESHPHSAQNFGPRTDEDTVAGRWINSVHDKLTDALAEAAGSLEPVSLKAARAPAQVGFNRRLPTEDGSIIMEPNRDGPVVPWVNVLVAERPDGAPLAVVFEHPAHPVIVPDTSGLISADYPGAAVVRIRELLGGDVVPLFAQGCGGNINAYPLRTTHENADKAGRELGDAVAEAVRSASPINSDEFTVREVKHVDMPSASLPPLEVVEEIHSQFVEIVRDKRETKWTTHQAFKDMLARLDTAREMIEQGIERGKPRRLDVTAVMLGQEWILVALSHEMFCQYELWVDEHAPFEHNMTMGYTNGNEGYIPVDEALKMGARGGYEAGKLPLWWACGAVSEFLGPPEVGVEAIIKNAIASLWEQAGQ